MGGVLLQPGTKDVLEWVFLLSLASSGLCVLGLVMMMIADRWRHAVRQRELNRRRTELQNDIRNLEARRPGNSQTAEAEKKQLPRYAEELGVEAIAIERRGAEASKT